MKLRYLFFCIICFNFLNNYGALEHSPEHCGEAVHDEFMMLTDNICDLLLQGNSPDKIIEIFGDSQKYPYDIEKLITKIQTLLNKQTSKICVINIIMDNKDAKEHFARKKFWKRVKLYCFTLKFALLFAAIVTIAIIACYLLSPWIPGLSGFHLGLSQIKKPCKSSLSKNSQPKNPPPIGKQADQDRGIPVHAIQEAHPLIKQEGLVPIDHPPDSFRFNPPSAKSNQALQDETVKLAAELMKHMGIDPATVQFDVAAASILKDIASDEEPKDNRKLSEQVAKLIETCKRYSAESGISFNPKDNYHE